MLPDLPTVSESGVKDFELVVWYALLAPAGTPKKRVARFNTSLNTVLKEKATTDKLQELSIRSAGGTADEANAYARAEAVRWKNVIEAADVKAE